MCRKATLAGEPVTLADAVDGVSVSATGLIAYRTAGGSQRQLTWVDRSGTARGTVGAPDGSLASPRVSPDGPVAWPWFARCRATATCGCWTGPDRAAAPITLLMNWQPKGKK
jgi:hypothetical protein